MKRQPILLSTCFVSCYSNRFRRNCTEGKGLEVVQNIRQLTSYAGLDVVKRESGTSVMGKTRISKKGNGRIRSSLYFSPMISSFRNGNLSRKYQRIIKINSVR